MLGIYSIVLRLTCIAFIDIFSIQGVLDSPDFMQFRGIIDLQSGIERSKLV